MPRMLKPPSFAVLIAAIALPPFFSQAQSAPQPVQPPASASAISAVTIKANARIVVVDVVVTDKNQNPVHNLKPSDFTVLDGSAAQTISHFEEHVSMKPGDLPAKPAPALPAGLFTNYTPTPANGALNVLLLDTLNTPMTDQAFVRQQLQKYLEQVEPGTRIAIFGLTNQLTMLQSFTSDPGVLKAVVAKTTAKGSPLLDDPVGGSGIENNEADDLEDGFLGTELAETIADLREFEAEQQSFQLQARAKYTLDAMNQIARYLAGIPGRKNLIWFSGSFPIDILPDTTGSLANPFVTMASSEDEFRDTVNMLARSQVAVYPIAAGGLTNSPVLSAATTRNYSGAKGTARMNQDNSKFYSNNNQAQSTMKQLADSTGGRAFVNTNGLAQAVASAIEEGSNFYTLTYTPIAAPKNGEFRKIKVEVSEQGLHLAYRQGYYGSDPEMNAGSDASDSKGPGPTHQESLRIAMMRGAPAPTEIRMTVGVVPMTPADQPEDKPAPGNVPSAKVNGPYRRYGVNYLVDPADVAFLRTADGMVRADLEFIVFVYNPDGTPLNVVATPIHVHATADQIKQAVAQGIRLRQEVSAPAKGEYFLRIAVHDFNRDRYGAVEVATSAVRNVVAPAAPPPSTGK